MQNCHVKTTTCEFVKPLFGSPFGTFVPASNANGQVLLQQNYKLSFAFVGSQFVIFDTARQQVVIDYKEFLHKHSEVGMHAGAVVKNEKNEMQICILGGCDSVGVVERTMLWGTKMEYHSSVPIMNHKVVARTAVVPNTLVGVFGVHGDMDVDYEFAWELKMNELNNFICLSNTVEHLAYRSSNGFALVYREEADSMLIFGGTANDTNLYEFEIQTGKWNQYDGPNGCSSCTFANGIMFDKNKLLITGQGATRFEPCAYIFHFNTLQWQSYHLITNNPISGDKFASGIASFDSNSFVMWSDTGLVNFLFGRANSTMHKLRTLHAYTDVKFY